jgi:hypothetical protein
MAARGWCPSCAGSWIAAALAVPLAACVAAPLGPVSDNPCSYVIPSGERIQQNAHLRLTRTYWGDPGLQLGVTCIHDPPGSPQTAGSGIDVKLYTGPGDYVFGGDSPHWGRIVVGPSSGTEYYMLETGSATHEPGTCTISVVAGPSTAPRVGDRIDAVFHCEGLQASSGKLGDIREGVFGGRLEYVE